MKENILETISNFLKKDFNSSLSVGYLSLVFVGMLFQGALYALFGINIVQYSDISDFLLAPFRNPTIILFTIFTIIFIYFFTIFDNWIDKSYPRFYVLLLMGVDRTKYKNWYIDKGVLLVFLVYVCLAATFYGSLGYKTIKNTTNSRTQLTFKDNKFVPSDTLIYIGKTNAYVFLYNRTKKQTDVVPIADVLKMEVRNDK